MKQLLMLVLVTISLSAFSQTNEKPKVEIPKTENTQGNLNMRIDTSFILNGKLPDFQLLYRAITTPGDVTPNQVKAIVEWLQRLELVTKPVYDAKKKN